jgi:hypothetical protein
MPFMVNVEEDYQVCVRLLARESDSKSTKKTRENSEKGRLIFRNLEHFSVC